MSRAHRQPPHHDQGLDFVLLAWAILFLAFWPFAAGSGLFLVMSRA
jgi:hypothetical protein